jgi:WG repeat protein
MNHTTRIVPCFLSLFSLRGAALIIVMLTTTYVGSAQTNTGDINRVSASYYVHRAAVRVKDKWGYVNELGEMIIPPQFDCADPFSEGLAYVCVKEERYFIDTSGRIVFRHDASLMTPFTNGLALLMSCSVLPCRSFYVDKQGRVVWQGVFGNPN